MPHVIYSGIKLTPISEFRLAYETVMDPSGLDFCFTAAHISGTFVVNGQVGPQGLQDPPVSLVPGPNQTRVAAAIATKPVGAGVVAPPNTEAGGERERGAVNDFASLRNRPYSGIYFAPNFAVEGQQVTGTTRGASPTPVTLNLLVERLSQPRGILFVYEDPGLAPDIIIQSPPSGQHCDAKGGPVPVLLDLTHTQGEGTTFFVSWACTTYLSRQKRTDRREALLSNRWVMTHHVRKGGFTDVEVQGEAIFDLGILHAFRENADNYRPNLLLPIPLGYERTDLEVTESEDGATVHYHFMDTQKEVFFPAGVYVDAVDIETEHRQYCLCENDILGGALQAMESTLNRRWLAKSAEEDSSARKTKRKRRKSRPKPPPSGTP